MLEHKEHFNRNKVRVINWVSFLVGFSQAMVIYVLSTYFKEISGTENVSIFYLASYAIILLFLFNLHKFTRILGKGRVFLFSVLAKIIANVFLILLPPAPWLIVILIAYVIFSGLEWANLDVILESFSKDKISGRIRGLHLTIINLGFIFGLFISMRLLDEFGFHGVFIAALILNGVIFLNALIGFRDINEVFTKKLKSIELLKKIFRRKDIFSIYLVSFSLEFFYALMVIYTPIYLSDLGISWGNIGIIFTVMLIPFVLLQYPAGILADRKRGEKGLIIFSLFLMLATTLVCFFTNTKEIFVWAAILFGTRIGAALVEILRDSYFYKKIDGQDVDIIGFFRTAMPVAYIAAAGVSAIWLLFFPVKAVFLVVSLVMVLALYPAFRLPSNK